MYCKTINIKIMRERPPYTITYRSVVALKIYNSMILCNYKLLLHGEYKKQFLTTFESSD